MVSKTKNVLDEFLSACTVMDTTRARLVENSGIFAPLEFQQRLQQIDNIKTQIERVQKTSAAVASVMTSALPPSHATLARVQKTMTGAASMAMQGAAALMRATCWKINRDIDETLSPGDAVAGMMGTAHFSLLGGALELLTQYSGKRH